MLQWLSRDIVLLLGNRGLRSFNIGIFMVILAIYLAKIGMTPLFVGLTVAISGSSAACWTLVGSILADRYGRKKILFFYGLIATTCAASLLLTRNPLLLMLSIAPAALGTPSGGSGPVGPSEQALLSEHSSPQNRTAIFAALSLVGAFGLSIGSFSATIPTMLQASGSSELDSYMPIFGVMTFAFFISSIIAMGIRETPRQLQARKKRKIIALSKESKTAASRFFLTGLIDFSGTSLTAPFYAYWFYLRFDADPGLIGLIFGVNFLLATISYPIAVRMSRRIGVVNAILVSRVPYLILLFALPFSPNIEVAAIVFLIRGTFMIMDIPLRQSYTMGIIRKEERASVAGISELARRTPEIVSPAVSGVILQIGVLFLPFVGAAMLQLSEILLFYKFFRKKKPPEEQLAKS